MKSVIIIEDDKIIVDKLKKFFETEMNFHVAGIAFDADTGLDLVKKEPPTLITLDIEMPGKNGLIALEEILDYNPEARVLMVSTLSETTYINRAMELGASGYIVKPLHFESEGYVKKIKNEIEIALEA